MFKFYCSAVTFLIILFRICSSTVIIIGSGPAGIAAASRLLKNNVTDILLLEAEDRIGGRINSVEFGNAFVDMGAEWCHGQENNIVYNLVKEYDILRHSKLANYDYLFYSNGEKVNSNFSEQLFNVIGSIYSADGSKKQEEGTTLGDYCISEYSSAVKDLNLNNTRYQKLVGDFLDFFQRFVISSEGSFTWFEPSAESDYRDCPGDLAQNWNGRGFKTVLDVLMQKFPNTSKALPIDDKIILNKEVKKIIWDSKDDDVIVKCSDGSWYHGEQLIFTPSLGVLKENHKTMFEPPLPQEKQLAIERLGISAVMKVMLLFPSRWWPANISSVSLVWSEEHKTSNLEKFIKNGKAWILNALALVPVENNPNVLCLWFTGTSIPDIELLDDLELGQGINFILQTFLGSTYQLSLPISIMKSRWYTNPHFRGTYSYQTTKSRQTTSNKDLSKPLFNRNGKLLLMFAGEATHPYYYSTVHGAIETGHREADRVLKLLHAQ